MQIIQEVTEKTIPTKKLIGIYLMTLGLSMLLMLIPVTTKEFTLNPKLGLLTLSMALFLMYVHELLHGLCFKIFTGKAKIGMKFNWRYGGIYGYATSPGYILSKVQMIYTLLAPQIVAVALLILLVSSQSESIRYASKLLIVTSLAGGCMDFTMLWYILKDKRVTHIIDKGSGIALLVNTNG